MTTDTFPRSLTKSLQVRCSQKHAFDVFTTDLPTWWPVDRHSISANAGHRPKGCFIDPKLGGAIYEIGHDDQHHPWGTITDFDPHRLFAFDWFVGRPPSESTHVRVEFTPLQPEMTQVTLTHSRWQRLGTAAAAIRDGYDSGWDLVFGSCYRTACS